MFGNSLLITADLKLDRMEHEGDGKILCGFPIGPARQLFIIWSQFVYLGY